MKSKLLEKINEEISKWRPFLLSNKMHLYAIMAYCYRSGAKLNDIVYEYTENEVYDYIRVSNCLNDIYSAVYGAIGGDYLEELKKQEVSEGAKLSENEALDMIREEIDNYDNIVKEASLVNDILEQIVELLTKLNMSDFVEGLNKSMPVEDEIIRNRDTAIIARTIQWVKNKMSELNGSGPLIRGFEKISFEQFARDYEDIDMQKANELYDSIELPRRATKGSAGYDIRAVGDWTIKRGETLKIPTGLKVKMQDNEVLQIFIRSSLGTKHHITLTNSVGIIDFDYYNNDSNEGHFWITIRNDGVEDYKICNGDRIAQGIFTIFLVTDDDYAVNERDGGFGSSGK